MPRQSHFNTLKQWGRNRLRLITSRGSSGSDNDRQPPPIDKQVSDIDDFNTQDTMRMNNAFRKRQQEKEKERKLSHERKPSYSSQSEKSVAATVTSLSTIPVPLNHPVKLRESSLIRRQRRHGLGQKEEQNSSSGNWSASSESGRTSIGSEITTTTHPKSSASSGSLNHHHQGSSGPPSSIISRRRFLNTSASSSITSEGTATPDLQTFGDFHDEGETSSIYSCDTEGYYTSFHMDSGLKTLKEEEPATPLHTSQNLSSTTSFESSGNQTVISPENEYELFGRGSTSTTTSSAGTICTVVLPGDFERNSVPQVPERKSSLTKLNRSSSSVSNSNTGTLERSYSSSTVGSTLERMGTIKRNGVLLQKEVQTLVSQAKEEALKVTRTESPDSGNNTSSSPIESNANSSPTQSQQGVRSNSEFEYSESSDLESVDRIERIRVKTTINTSRIPSMCVITPGNSDDDEGIKNRKNSDSSEDRELLPQVIEIAFGDETPINESQIKRMATTDEDKHQVYDVPNPQPFFKKEVFKKTTLLPLGSFMGKLRGVLNKKSPNKDTAAAPLAAEEDVTEIYADNCGEYVTIADVANNNKKQNRNSGVYYSNDVVKRNLATVLSGNLNEETEYVSLNELPCNIRCESNLLSSGDDTDAGIDKNTTRENDCSNTTSTITTEMEGNPHEQNRIKGARVTLDAHGKVVYSSDSLKRRKGAHTTFAPGPNVKDTKQSESVASETSRSEDIESIVIPPAISSPLLSGGVLNRKLNQVRPVVSQRLNSPIVETLTNTQSAITMRGAYVNLQDVQANSNPLLMTQSHYDYSTSPMMMTGNNEGKIKIVSSDKYKLNPVQLVRPKLSKIGFSPNSKHKLFSLPPSPLTLSHHTSTSSTTKSERENENVDPNNASENIRVVKRSNSYRLANNAPSTPVLVLKNTSFEFASIHKSTANRGGIVVGNHSQPNNCSATTSTTRANASLELISSPNNEKINNNTLESRNYSNSDNISPLISPDSPPRQAINSSFPSKHQPPIWSPKNKLYKELTAISYNKNMGTDSLLSSSSPMNCTHHSHANPYVNTEKSKAIQPTRIYDKSRHVHRHRNNKKKSGKKISIHSISSPIAGTLIRRSKTDEGFASLDENEEDEDDISGAYSEKDESQEVVDKSVDVGTEVLETNFELYDIPSNLPYTTPKIEAHSSTDKTQVLTQENEFVDSDDDTDDEIFYNPPNSKLKPIIYPMTPNKVTIPADSSQHRARFLSTDANSNDSSTTDIW